MIHKWITFDLDGTIMQNPFMTHVFPEVQRLITNKNKDLIQCIDAFVAEHQQRLRESKYVEAYDWEEIVATYTRLNDLDISLNVEETVKKYCVPGAIYLLEEGIIEVLQKLRQRGYSLAVVTNGFSIFQLPVMDALGLTPYFDRILTPDKVGYAKPDIRVFTVHGEIIAHVGDRLDQDVIPANTLGVKAIWINRSLPSHLSHVKPELRARAEGIDDILLTKLRKETQVRLSSVPVEAIPTHIIFRITELLDVLV